MLNGCFFVVQYANYFQHAWTPIPAAFYPCRCISHIRDAGSVRPAFFLLPFIIEKTINGGQYVKKE